MSETQDQSQRRSGVVTTVTLPAIMLSALDKEAQRTQVFSRSAIVRQAVKEYLDKRNGEAETKEAA